LAAEKPWWHRADASAKSFTDVPDDVIDSLAPEHRAQLAGVWQNRAGLELQVGVGFAAIAGGLVEHGAIQPVIELVTAAVRAEVRHAEISASLAARYYGNNVTWPRPEKVLIPAFAPATGAFKTTLHVIAMCCINETLACAVLEACVAQAKSPLVRAAQQSILSDEIDHARAGWAHLASPFVSAETKRALAPWLRRLLAGKLDALLDEAAPLPGEAFPAHGMLARETFVRVIHAALDDVVFPGFDRAGIDTTDAREWNKAKTTA
jgi:hypothetical protein